MVASVARAYHRIGFQEPLEKRWRDRRDELLRLTADNDPLREHLQSPMHELTCDQLDDAIVEAARKKLPPPPELWVRQVRKELSALRQRYQAAWQGIAAAQRQLVITANSWKHAALRDLPKGWNVVPEVIGDGEFPDFKDSEEAQAATEGFLSVVMALEAKQRTLEAAVRFDKAPTELQHSSMLRALHERIAALEEKKDKSR